MVTICCVARLLHLELPDKHSRIDDIFPRMFGPLWGSMHIIHSTAMYPDDRAGMYLIIPLVFIAIFFADEWSQFVTRWWGLDQRHHSRQCSKFRFQSQKDLRGDQPEKWRGIRMPGAGQKPIWMERSQPNIPLFHRKTRYKKADLNWFSPDI